jgi:hypothetical protein
VTSRDPRPDLVNGTDRLLACYSRVSGVACLACIIVTFTCRGVDGIGRGWFRSSVGCNSYNSRWKRAKIERPRLALCRLSLPIYNDIVESKTNENYGNSLYVYSDMRREYCTRIHIQI